MPSLRKNKRRTLFDNNAKAGVFTGLSAIGLGSLLVGRVQAQKRLAPARLLKHVEIQSNFPKAEVSKVLDRLAKPSKAEKLLTYGGLGLFGLSLSLSLYYAVGAPEKRRESSKEKLYKNKIQVGLGIPLFLAGAGLTGYEAATYRKLRKHTLDQQQKIIELARRYNKLPEEELKALGESAAKLRAKGIFAGLGLLAAARGLSHTIRGISALRKRNNNRRR